MKYILLSLIAILPGIAIAVWIMRQDKYEKEPLRLAIGCFVSGILSTIPAIALQQALHLQEESSTSLLHTFIHCMFGIGLSEEFSKFVFLRLYAYTSDEWNEPMDGIVYSVLISMGFATLENVFYSLQGWQTAVARALTAVPAHAAFGVLMGAFVGAAKFLPEQRGKLIFLGLFLATLFHGLYDFFLLQEAYQWLAILALVVLLLGLKFSRMLIREWQDNSPFKEDRDVSS